jgi:protein-S-isoprenylcysteine O-methyltransferase Ste14
MVQILRHLRSFIAPLVVGGVVPGLIVWFERGASLRSGIMPPVGWVITGAVISVLGLALVVATIRMFIRIGDGTIMPWDPTRTLVVVSLYSHVRNPMILSLIVLQVGQALMFTSYGVGMLAIFNFILNTVYFIYSEEPGLEVRFGEAYLAYKQNVPRWIPRLKPWRPS